MAFSMMKIWIRLEQPETKENLKHGLNTSGSNQGNLYTWTIHFIKKPLPRLPSPDFRRRLWAEAKWRREYPRFYPLRPYK